MTKEQVQKHGNVIKWFCDNPDKGVWLRSDNGEWILTHIPLWNIQCKYIQNDEYAELRKAQADGKQIQYFIQGKWEDTSAIHNHIIDCSEHYRIKPDEPKFKVGDWVRDKVNCKVIKLRKHFHEGGIELWQPQEGDVAIFLDEPTPRLLKLQTCNILYAKSLFITNRCIPYIGQPFEEIK